MNKANIFKIKTFEANIYKKESVAQAGLGSWVSGAFCVAGVAGARGVCPTVPSN